MGVGPRAARAPRAPGGRMATGSAHALGGDDGDPRADAWWCETNGAECGPWQEGQPLPEPVTFAALAAATSSFFLVGGLTASGASASVYRGDPGPDGLTWTEQQPLPAPVFAAAATIVGDRLYVLGGAPSFEEASSAAWRAPLRSDGFLGEWGPVGTLPAPVLGHGAIGIDDHLLLVGGYDWLDASAAAYLAPAAAELDWVDAAALATPRFAMGVAEGVGAVYLVGGWTAGFAELTGGIVWASACP